MPIEIIYIENIKTAKAIMSAGFNFSKNVCMSLSIADFYKISKSYTQHIHTFNFTKLQKQHIF